MKTIVITETHQKKFKLPAKALGEWKVENVSEKFITLHKVKSDGTLGSNRAGNIVKIDSTVFMELANQAEAKTYEDKNSDLEKRITELFKLSARRIKWLIELINAMNTEPFTQALIQDMGEIKFIEKVLADTNPEREFGKAYSSISSAMKVWNSRIMRGVL